jgi:CBS domain-containing protein
MTSATWVAPDRTTQLPIPEDEFLAQQGPMPTTHQSRRSFHRFYFRGKGVLQWRGETLGIYSTDLSRKGMGLLARLQLLGVISELAFLDALFDRGFRNAPVAEFMTRQVHFVEPEDTLEHVAHMFQLYRLRRLPVLEAGQVVGIVTRRDLIRHVLATNESLENPLESLLPRIEELAL